jgi:hypothetical protein
VKNLIECHTPFTAQEIINRRMSFLLVLMLFADSACMQRHLATSISEERNRHRDEFPSAAYNHFEGGVLFSDVAFGLNVLWKASFKNGCAYKENLAFFVPGGLLISPNKENTLNSAKLSALSKQVIEKKLFVLYDTILLEVLAIIHTHPDPYSKPIPAPRNDYQYCYLGIHNYIMDHHNLFDAYKDAKGRETYKRLGSRIDYHRFPLYRSESMFVNSTELINIGKEQ